MSFLKASIAFNICLSITPYVIYTMDREPVMPATLTFKPAGSLQEELNNDQSKTNPAFPRHLFFDLGLRLDENAVKQALQEQKKTFKSFHVECKTETGEALNKRLLQTRPAGHQMKSSPIAPEDTVIVITIQVCGHPVTISMPVDQRNSINEQGLKVQLRRRIADIIQQVGSFQQTHIGNIRKNVKEFRRSETGVALLKTLPRTYLVLCQFIAKDLTEDLSDSAQAAINSAELKKHDEKIATTKTEFEENIKVLRKLEPVVKNAKLLNELEGTRSQSVQALKSKIQQLFCSSFEQYVQSQVER